MGRIGETIVVAEILTQKMNIAVSRSEGWLAFPMP